MKKTSLFHLTQLAAVAAAAVLVAGPALAADGASQRFQQERVACLAGQTQQDRATCLREAGAALEEARRGRLSAGQADYQDNALLRCQALPEAERADCVARMEGDSTTVSGSVAGGGLLRERVTIVPAPEAGAPSQ